MEAIDKESGCKVEVLQIEGTAEIMKDGVILYRRMEDLEVKDPSSISLNHVVKVTLTRDGAWYLNHKGKLKKNGKKWSKDDDYVTVMWKLFPTFKEFYHPGADAPYKNIREA